MTAREQREHKLAEEGAKHDARIRRREQNSDDTIPVVVREPARKRLHCEYPYCDCAGMIGDCPEQAN